MREAGQVRAKGRGAGARWERIDNEGRTPNEGSNEGIDYGLWALSTYLQAA